MLAAYSTPWTLSVEPGSEFLIALTSCGPARTPIFPGSVVPLAKMSVMSAHALAEREVGLVGPSHQRNWLGLSKLVKAPETPLTSRLVGGRLVMMAKKD